MGTTPPVLITLVLAACTVDMSSTEQALTVRRTEGHDDVWSESDKRNLTYCLDASFGDKTAYVARILGTAARQWERRADIRFVHVTSEDGAGCTSRNERVVFNVRRVDDESFAARAFYPSTPRVARELLVNAGTLGNTPAGLVDVFGHELGHALGFRHEQVQLGIYGCEEGGEYRGITDYDNASIMHYVQCASRYRFMHWTKRDREGAALVYGAGRGLESGWRSATGHRVSLQDTREIITSEVATVDGFGDFDGDGVLDDVSGLTLDGFSIAAIRDFSGDGVADIVWRSANGAVRLWLFSNRQVWRKETIELGTLGLDWQLVGAGDLDGDVRADLVWRHTSGRIVVWFMDGAVIASAGEHGVMTTEWRLEATGDADGDFSEDLLWRHQDGRLAIWTSLGVK